MNKNVTLYNFIFSNRPFIRIGRHLAFWIIFCFWFLVHYETGGLKLLPFVFSRLLFCILSTYLTLYVLIPRYLLRKEYKTFFLCLFILNIVFPVLYFLDPLVYFLLPERYALDRISLWDGTFDKNDFIFWKVTAWDAWGLTMCANGFAAVIRLMKLFYLENSENKRLLEQKVSQEFFLLKSQLNSRFLFDALQSIHQNLLRKSPSSPSLVLTLADLLSYLLYENDEKTVPLAKEISVIEGYLKLENEGHENSVNIQITQRGEINEKRIVPLVILPLVETCFESYSGSQKGAGIFLDFDVQGFFLKVTLKIHNLQNFSQELFQKSARIKNVIQRLNVFYTGNYQMHFEENKQHCIVQLDLKL